ncbi:hypothetical protein TWF225_003517 [Orbilia oligospora]|nr:hypothetical protein TWF225_003517 [Orbilia oligospora]KAF3258465.1 hypothetical protein TWF128_004708 [Orbilia oligospora]KAF3271147.1 hypothetical protein TWF217_005563 [Orbilia oligospora]KAF3282124.1 hypothetical protein TWF132_010823 [Orbilia oligospora]
MDFKPRSLQPHPADFAKEMVDRKSGFTINTRECDPLNAEIMGENTYTALFPDESKILFQMIHLSPVSLITWNFFRQRVHGQIMPWLNGQSIYFPEIDKYKPASFIPIQNNMKDSSAFDGVDVTFKRSRTGFTKLRVWGLTELPIVIGGIPLRITCLIVDSLPLYRTTSACPIPDMLLLATIFNGLTTPLEYCWGIRAMRYRTGNVSISTRILPETGNIAMEVYADVANLKSQKRGAVYDFGYSAWFGEDCVFNKYGTMEFSKPQADCGLEIRGALQALYAIRDVSTYSYSSFDYTDVIFYCSSRHIVSWANQWSVHGSNSLWVKKLRMEQRLKDLWTEVLHTIKAANKTFHWYYIEPRHNEEAMALSHAALMRLPRPTQLLINEPHNLLKLRGLMKAKQRPSNHFEGLSLEGGMCRRKHPKGFKIDLCCVCTKQNKPWEQHFHY